MSSIKDRLLQAVGLKKQPTVMSWLPGYLGTDEEGARKAWQRMQEEWQNELNFVRQELSTEEHLQHFTWAQQIIDIFDEHSDDSSRASDQTLRAEGRGIGAEQQTNTGLLLVLKRKSKLSLKHGLNYRSRTKVTLWTPWGAWVIAEFKGPKDLNFLRQLALEQWTGDVPEQDSDVLQYVVSVLGIDGMPLPTPVLVPSRHAYPEEQARILWRQAKAQYYEQQGLPVPLDDEEKYSADIAFLQQRGQGEPPPGPGDIAAFEDLLSFLGQTLKFYYSKDDFWLYGQVANELDDVGPDDPAPEVYIHWEITPHQGFNDYLLCAIDASDFKRGLVARPASAEEIEHMTFDE